MTELEKFMTYTEYEVVDTVGFQNTDIDKIIDSFRKKKDVILFGPPGTGKTYLLDQLIESLGDSLGMYEKIQFHSNYSYDEFIEGIIPDVDAGGFKYQDGIFLNFCKDATKPEYTDKVNVFLIDEINRADITSVFGEVMNLIENKGARKIKTSKTHQEISIPENVFIIGTMNTADKSLSRLDFALRRRFRFLPVYPSSEILHRLMSSHGFDETVDFDVDIYVKCFDVVNAKIVRHPLLGKDLTLGHILWIPEISGVRPFTANDIANVFRESILPQIESYVGSNADVLGNILGSKMRDSVIIGREISNQDIIDFIKLASNNKVVEA